MPVKIPDQLPAAQTLAHENIFVMDSQRATTQDIRPLRIAILNLMPTKESTETQLLRLIGNTPLQVEITLLNTASYQSQHTEQAHLDSFYRTWDEIKDEMFDGLIITGAPVEQMDFEKVAYWEEMVQIMSWANEHVYSTLFICWAAQAAMYHYYNIPKNALPKKIFGVFEHRVLQPTHKLVRGFDDTFYAPHSRHTAFRTDDVLACPELDVLSISRDAGVYLCASKDGRRIFVTGHSEYDRGTLEAEYKRDVAAGKPIEIPCNYYPNNDPSKEPYVTWRSHGNLLFANWLNYFVYQETPFDISAITPKG